MEKTNPKSILKCVGLLWIVLILTACNKPIFHDRPTIESCKDYLTGQRLLVEKGAILDTTWKIESNEFTSFETQSIISNGDGTKSAKVRFELKYQGKILKVDGTVKYGLENGGEFVRMLSFTPERIVKLGKW
jgi:hypothetical protein